MHDNKGAIHKGRPPFEGGGGSDAGNVKKVTQFGVLTYGPKFVCFSIRVILKLVIDILFTKASLSAIMYVTASWI